MLIPMKEKDLKLAVEEYLQYQQNLGELWFTRLNSGVAYVKRADKYYAIKLSEAGTADFIVVRGWRTDIVVLFLELKGTKGKATAAQDAFAKKVNAQGCYYYIIRSIPDLESVLSG